MGRRRMWDPISDLVTMQQVMDRLYEDSMERRGPSWRREGRVSALPVDVYSTADALVVQASVPGLDPENVEITIEGETLTIKGETKPPLDHVEYHIQERFNGPFSRTLALNVPVQPELAEAIFESGVLTLTIPKAQEVRPRVIQVRTKGTE